MAIVAIKHKTDGWYEVDRQYAEGTLKSIVFVHTAYRMTYRHNSTYIPEYEIEEVTEDE